jgi:catechol 2,3-dioxygenase-like lactoylglutathione lyase family enzyme
MNRIVLHAFVMLCSLSLVAGEAPVRPRIIAVAFVRLRVSDLESSRQFYANTFLLGYHRDDCVGPHSVCFRWNTLQKLELVQRDLISGDGLLEEIGFSTTDLNAMRRYLIAHGLHPNEIHKDWDGQEKFELQDFDGPHIAFVSPTLPGSYVSWPGQVSDAMIHTGFVVRDRAAEDHFYKDILGFHLYWHGGMKDDKDDWVAMQVPDGTDWVEYMLNISPTASKHTLGVMNHLALGVTDIHATEQQLIKNGWNPKDEPKLGRDGKWQLNLYDPDDTRVEFMEFKPKEKPCCSEFTGPHPGPTP